MNSYLLVLTFVVALMTAGCGGSNGCQESDCDDGNSCTADVCNLENGVCEFTEAPDFTLCEVDSVPGLCASGECAQTSCEGLDCDDGNPCTVDGCFEGLGVCVGITVPAMTTCEVDGAFGRCNGPECDLDFPPTGEAELQVSLPDIEASVLAYDLACASDLTLSGNLAKVGDDWQASFTLPAGDCTLQLFARNPDGEVICQASEVFTVFPDTLTPVLLVLLCAV